MNTIRVALIGLVTLGLGSSASALPASFSATTVNATLALQLARCRAALANVDAAACPRAKAYKTTKTLTASRLRSLVEGSLGLDPAAVQPQAAIQLIKDSMTPQLGALLASGEGSAAAAARFAQTRTDLQVFIANLARAGAAVLVDADTYWAPSVNARAVVLVERARKRVTLILHGDTDG